MNRQTYPLPRHPVSAFPDARAAIAAMQDAFYVRSAVQNALNAHHMIFPASRHAALRWRARDHALRLALVAARQRYNAVADDYLRCWMRIDDAIRHVRGER